MGKMKEVFMETRLTSVDDFDYQYTQWLQEQNQNLVNDLKTTRYMFVYGTLMRNYHNSIHLKKSKYIGKATTMQPYLMTAYSYCSIPFVIKHLPQSLIQGELFEINSEETLNRIDMLEGHPHGYRREVISVKVNDEIYKAWIYFYPTYSIKHMNIISSGDYNKYTEKFKNNK